MPSATIASTIFQTSLRRRREQEKKERRVITAQTLGGQFLWTACSLKFLLMRPLKEINIQVHSSPRNFVRVAPATNQKFGCECSPLHVENHLRTVKKTWSTISLLRGRIGYGWDANLNMIVCDKQQYDEEVTIFGHGQRFVLAVLVNFLLWV
ncbi:hypothetical protein RJ639_029526 [Escallonia herrerae]|uniref:Myb/SANT-like domain-containing protein n=1 Tax=Escallonia herrerae TaxID=1293975 RepID=A0AA88U1B6_9ASTE|nr:hypothetical protein RJ639_029526 [Escallonia herrerae]